MGFFKTFPTALSAPSAKLLPPCPSFSTIQRGSCLSRIRIKCCRVLFPTKEHRNTHTPVPVTSSHTHPDSYSSPWSPGWESHCSLVWQPRRGVQCRMSSRAACSLQGTQTTGINSPAASLPAQQWGHQAGTATAPKASWTPAAITKVFSREDKAGALADLPCLKKHF